MTDFLTYGAITLWFGEILGCIIFCILFGRKWRTWIRTRMGPNLFAMMFVLAVLQGVAGVRLVAEPEWLDVHYIAIRFWSFAALAIVVWWRCGLLIKIQHEDAVREAKEAADRAAAEIEQKNGSDDSDPDLLRSGR